MFALLKRLIRNEHAATALEYGLIAGLTASMLIAVYSVWPEDMYGNVTSAFQNSH